MLLVLTAAFHHLSTGLVTLDQERFHERVIISNCSVIIESQDLNRYLQIR